jgi:membrane-bound serine protease (ClpP class)
MVHIGRWVARAALLSVVAGALLGGVRVAHAQPERQAVDVVQITGFIDPPVARHVISRLEAAESNGADAVVLQVDSPGGLQVSNTELVNAILDCPVPVIGWVAPRDARAASTGLLVALSADRTFVADSTVLGPLFPAPLDGRNTAAGVPGDVDEEAFRAAMDADQAISERYAEGAASSLGDLLQALDGDAFLDATRGSSVLETWDESIGAPSATIRFAQMNPFDRLLHAVTDPKVALLLFLAGLFGIIFELYNPGIGLAAIVGAGALALSVYSLSILPTNWGAVLVITAGVGLLLVDLHAAALGLPSALGVIALVAGCVFLYSGAPEVLELSPWAIAAAVAFTLLFFISVMTAALRVRLRRPVDDDAGVVGTIGEATTDIAPEGTVLTKGTLWRARTMETGIAAGAKVEVKATEGLVLLVEPLHEHDPETTKG